MGTSKKLSPRWGPNDLTLNKIMIISIGGFAGLIICILTVHFFVRRSKRKKMGLPIRTRRRKHHSLTELESRLSPPDFNAIATRTEHDWQSSKRFPSSAITYNAPLPQAGVPARTEKPISKHLSGESAYDFSQAGQRRVEIAPQRPPRPERTNFLNETNDFRSILVPSPIPSPIQAPPPVSRSNSRQYSPTQSTYSMPSPSASTYRSALEPPPISPKSPLRKQRLPSPRSPPPSTPPPPIPPFPQIPLQSLSAQGNTRHPVRQEVSYQDSHHCRESLSSTNVSSSGRPSDVDAGNSPTLMPDSDRMETPPTSEPIIRSSSKRLQKPKHPRLGHRRTRTEGEAIPISISGGSSVDAQGEFGQVDGALSRDGSRGSKASSMVLQLASGWDPSSSSEDEGMVRGGKVKRKKRKGKPKDQGKYGKGRKGGTTVDR